MVSHVHSAERGHAPRRQRRSGIARLWYENGLSLSLLVLFLASVVGQVAAGLADYNAEAAEYGAASVGLVRYLRTGHFLEALFENWESEFLQMSLFVLLTIGLRQKGSSESKSLSKSDEVDRDPRRRRHEPGAPWPVRRGGVWLALYEHSLTIALVALFVTSFALHAVGGVANVNHERFLRDEAPLTLFAYVASARFWYESFQNWQSEFLSVFAVIVLSIFLRQRGSPQSKPVAAPHSQTGE